MPNLNSDFITEFIKQLGKFFRTLSNFTKVTLFVISVLMIFWFLSIYFIGKNFYDTNPIWITLLLCFVISIAWLVANIILLSAGLIVLNPIFEKENIDTSMKEEELIMFGGLNSIVYFTIMLFIAYYYAFPYKKFVIWCSSYPVFGLIILGGLFIYTRKQSKI